MNPLQVYRRARDGYLLSKALRDGLRLGSDVRIIGIPRFGSEPYLISIGNHVTVSADVTFITHDGGTWVFRDRPGYENLQRFGRIDVGDNCFIGARAILLPRITIGPNSVVGAGSVVSRDVPPDSVFAGVPARFICTYDEYVSRSAARSTPYEPSVARDPVRLKAALTRQYPHPGSSNRGSSNP